jgi:4-hydroxybenzoate polyprenyltransferase
MGSCRTFLWLVAGSAGGAEIMDAVMVCSLCLGGYVVGISLFARNESRRSETSGSSPLAVLLLFSPCLLTLGLVVMWNHLDPTRVFLLNISGLFLGWLVIKAILTMKNTEQKGAIGQGVSILLAGICSVDALAVCFFVPALIAPCYLAQFSAHILQKKFAAT